jgi:hypothetical protein
MDQDGHIDAFVGESPPSDDVDSEEEPDFMAAVHRAVDAAGEAGYGGRSFDIKVEVDLLEHNQWIKTMRVIITPHS